MFLNASRTFVLFFRNLLSWGDKLRIWISSHKGSLRKWRHLKVRWLQVNTGDCKHLICLTSTSLRALTLHHISHLRVLRKILSLKILQLQVMVVFTHKHSPVVIPPVRASTIVPPAPTEYEQPPSPLVVLQCGIINSDFRWSRKFLPFCRVDSWRILYLPCTYLFIFKESVSIQYAWKYINIHFKQAR